MRLEATYTFYLCEIALECQLTAIRAYADNGDPIEENIEVEIVDVKNVPTHIHLSDDWRYVMQEIIEHDLNLNNPDVEWTEKGSA